MEHLVAPTGKSVLLQGVLTSTRVFWCPTCCLTATLVSGIHDETRLCRENFLVTRTVNGLNLYVTTKSMLMIYR